MDSRDISLNRYGVHLTSIRDLPEDNYTLEIFMNGGRFRTGFSVTGVRTMPVLDIEQEYFDFNGDHLDFRFLVREGTVPYGGRLSLELLSQMLKLRFQWSRYSKEACCWSWLTAASREWIPLRNLQGSSGELCIFALFFSKELASNAAMG